MKKERLELKHLAPYLPYGLKVNIENYRIKRLLEVISMTSDYVEVVHNNVYDSEFYDLEYVIPILKPLSDLDDLIYDEFIKLENSKNKDYENEIINLFCFENTKETSNISCADINKLPYECVEYMFENHYDVFGLIDKGLAVSIHDVK